jgi:glycosyltransferase involved in cell wall biosynthesis
VRGTWDLTAARRLRRLLRTWRPHVVHAHGARAHAVALIALLGRDVPLVVTRRSAAPVAVGAQLRYRARVARFVAVSGAAQVALLRAGVPVEAIAVVPPGLAPPPPGAAFRPRDWRAERGWPPEALVVGVVGMAGADDGPAAFAGALAERLGPALAARLHLVRFGGPGAGAESLAGVPGVRAGLVDDMSAALAGLDLLVHVPRADRLGLAALEAMGLGVPVVSVPAGGLDELVHDGVDVVLVAAGAPGALPGALAVAAGALLADPARRAAVAEAARVTAAAHDVPRMVDGTLHVYAAALGGATPGAAILHG